MYAQGFADTCCIQLNCKVQQLKAEQVYNKLPKTNAQDMLPPL